MTYPFEYRAKIWNDDERKGEIVRGIVRAENYGDAGAKLDKYYGDELIGFTIYALEEDDEVMDFNLLDGSGLFNYSVTDTEEMY